MFFTGLNATSTKDKIMVYCTGSMTDELVVFEFSYLRNQAVRFDEAVTYYIK